MSRTGKRLRLDLMVERPNSSGSPPMWRPSSYPQVMFGRDEITATELEAVTARIRAKAGDSSASSEEKR